MNLVNSNWHYFVEFDETINRGTTGRYMGKTKEVIDYINNNIEKIPLDFINYKYDNDDNEDDLLHILHGITFGISLQRIMELSSSSEVSNKIIYPQKVNTNLAFSVIRSITQTLGSWNSFYGEIQFNSNGVNAAHKGFTFQIQYNTSETDKSKYETTISVPVSPSTVPNCNLDISKRCNASNNYRDCSCKVIYPANWEWRSSIDDNYIKFSSPFGIVFLLFDMCLILCFFYVSLLVVRRILYILLLLFYVYYYFI